MVFSDDKDIKMLKILMIGDSNTNKPNIILSYCSDTDSICSPITTIGIDFKMKQVEIDGKTYKLQIWDTAGQERFTTITSAYFRGANGIFVLYNILDRHSFERADRWLKLAKESVNDATEIILVGNSLEDPDASSTRVISIEEGQDLARRNNVNFIEMIVQDKTSVTEGFETLIRGIIEKQCENPISPPVPRKVNIQPPKEEETFNKEMCNLI